MNKTFALTVLMLGVPALAAAQPTSPYAGQESRDIKSLSPEEIQGYLAGDGLGFAKAGELNHYPGPKHVLGMADHLGLSPDQRDRISAISAKMSAAAVPLGRAIVDAERRLNAGFAAGTMDEPALRAQTARIAEMQGRLRAVHLSAHLATRAVLTPEQIAMYDQMRGYGGNAPPSGHTH